MENIKTKLQIEERIHDLKRGEIPIQGIKTEDEPAWIRALEWVLKKD